ncbi:MAG TPA: serine hydrolase [Phototrophicaceae bacterium]|nr:serine hydrolase [Phototrophicaceae bacterium]
MVTIVNKALQYATPESQGIASSTILKFVEAVERQIHEFHSFILVRHGKIVAEGWWSPCRRENPHMLFSLSKSFTSTAVGMAIAEGYFSLDDTVLSFFPDEAPAEVNEHLAAMQVRHLLSMSTGHAEDTTPTMIDKSDGVWTKGFFTVPVLHKPGTHFLYNTGATYMLSAIIQKTTGQNLIDFLEPRLFQPLNIENPTWEISPQGIHTGGFGLSIKTEDIAKFGQFYLQKGMWSDTRLISEAWVNEATSAQVSNGTDPKSDWAQGYGYQFWRCKHNNYRGDGAFGQYCIVMPEQDAVLAITAGLGDMQEPLNLVWDILFPAMTSGALPEDPAAHNALTAKLSSLAIAPVSGEQSSSTSTTLTNRTYTIDTNPLNAETIRLTTTETGWTLTFKTARSEDTIPCGYGSWEEGQTLAYNEPWRQEFRKVATSGAWTAPDTFSMVVRLYETPFFHKLNLHFAGDQLTIESRVNVGFIPPETLTLTAHATA